MHKCNMCNANKACTHTPAKCTNYHENHETKSWNCEINRTLKKTFKTFLMNSEHLNFQNIENLKFAQHNCWKFIPVMQFLLKYAKSNTMNIVLIQKSWIKNDGNSNNFIIFHSNNTCIIPKIKECKSLVIKIVNKCRKDLTCTTRIDLMSDSGVRILGVVVGEIGGVGIVSICNEKNQKSKNQTKTIDRLLNINIGENLIANGNFNAHHNWWNFKILIQSGHKKSSNG